MTDASSNWKAPIRPVRSIWNIEHLLRRGYLTDAKIERYAEAGWYSDEFRKARRERAEKRAKAKAKRDGNFVEMDGRWIYSPL